MSGPTRRLRRAAAGAPSRRAGGPSRHRRGGHPRRSALAQRRQQRPRTAPPGGCACSPSSRRSSPPRLGLVGASRSGSRRGRRRDGPPTTPRRWCGSSRIHADLVRADAVATNAFLVGGLEDAGANEPTTTRASTASPPASPTRRTPSPPTATRWAPSIAEVADYAAPVEQARAYNRQGLPVGAQYLSRRERRAAQRRPARSSRTLVDANEARADAEFDASSRLLTLILIGLGRPRGARARHGLAGPAHPSLPQPVDVRRLPGASCSRWAIGLVTLAWVGSQVRGGRSGSFAYTVTLADARDGGLRRQAQREPHPDRPRVRAGLRDGMADAVGQPRVARLSGPRRHHRAD